MVRMASMLGRRAVRWCGGRASLGWVQGELPTATTRVQRKNINLPSISTINRTLSSSSDLKAKSQPLNWELSETDRALLASIRVVEEVGECRRVVDRLLEQGEPLAVDMEGIMEGVTGLVQVRDTGGQFYFFRPRKNPALYRKGGLAELLEAPHILKILHASSGDSAAMYRDGVGLWGVWDTEVAYRVLQYFAAGESLISQPNIGLNPLCTFCGLEENPLKGRFDFRVGAKQYEDAAELSTDFLLYCAWDVAQLHAIHATLAALLPPDAAHLHQQLCELHLLRPIDPHLTRLKRNRIRSMEASSVFLSKLRPSITKPDLYKQISMLEGHKHVLVSPGHRTAHLLLDSRQAAVQALELLAPSLGDARLLIRLEEFEELEAEGGQAGQDGLAPLATCREVLGAVARARTPVVVDFVAMGEDTVVELYLGASPIVKLPLSKEMVEAGLGEVMASEEVAKVVLKVDTEATLQALKALTRLGVRVAGVFDLESAAKFADYAEVGQSVFTAASKKIQKMAARFGLPDEAVQVEGKVVWLYLSYLHLSTHLPPPILAMLQEKTVLEVGLGSYTDLASFKERRQQLRTRLDSLSLHLRKLSGTKPAFRAFVESALREAGREAEGFTELPRGAALLHFEDRSTCRRALAVLQAKVDSGTSGFRFVVTSPESLGTLTEKPPPAVQADLAAVEGRRRAHLAALAGEGLTHLTPPP